MHVAPHVCLHLEYTLYFKHLFFDALRMHFLSLMSLVHAMT